MRRLALGLALLALALILATSAQARPACLSTDCGPYSATLNWSLPPFPNVTGYNLFVNGSQVGASSSSPFVFPGIDCADGPFTLGVQPHGTSTTGPTYNTSYTAPGCGSLAPAETAEPVVSGTVATGSVLSTTNGSWTGSPTGFAYHWQDCAQDGTGCSNITGATSSTYTVASGDAGHTIEAIVTASNGGGSTDADAPIVPLVDNFTSDANTLDTHVWNPVSMGGLAQECYFPSQDTVDSSGLEISEVIASYSCPAGNPGTYSTYKSGAVTATNAPFTFGTVKASIKMSGSGPNSTHDTWPAFWLLGAGWTNWPTSSPSNPCTWPQDSADCSEIDINEDFGGSTTALSETLHNNPPGDIAVTCSPSAGVDISAGFHTYEVDWSSGSLAWKFDGTTECSTTSNVPSHPMQVIFDLSVCAGGTGCTGANTADFPQAMTVAWVHVSH
jgi:beta-glucanase (GH16 family)